MAGPTNPAAVAIVGRPNVGKSALFNRLVGRNVAIVHDQPGITRDRISGICSRATPPFLVWDTGGIVGTGESQLTDDVRRVVEDAIQDSAVLLFVVDARHGVSPMDAELARTLRKTRKPVVLVVNKVDIDKHESLAVEFDSLGFENTVDISAAHGRNISALIETVEGLLPSVDSQSPPPKTEDRIRVAIVGRPNVGKSSLINSIIESPRAIVSELAGTTRDSVDIAYDRGPQKFLFIDTAGIRRRGAHSSSVEVFSVMRAERSIRRADLCILLIDATSGVTAQDKRIAGLIQKAGQPCIIVLNKWDLLRPKRDVIAHIGKLADTARAEMFFLDYAPILVASARTGENVSRLFRLVDKVRGAARKRISTGVLNRLLRSAFAANPPPMVSGKRLKLFYTAQAGGPSASEKARKQVEEDPNAEAVADAMRFAAPEFVLFVNNPALLSDTYRRYLEAQIRKAEPYVGLPVTLTLRRRTETPRR